MVNHFDKIINIEQIFNNMKGIWIIDRDFKSDNSNFMPKVAGQATIKPLEDNKMLYLEEVDLSWPEGLKNQAYQSYTYSLKGGVITKFQNHLKAGDLTPSKMFDLNFLPPAQNLKSIIASGIFYCHRDIYEAKFIFKDYNNFRIEYKVTGPHKCYQIFTAYARETVGLSRI